MHLHPLIHSEFVRQHELDLSRRTLRAPLSSDRARSSLPSKETAVKIAALFIAMIATLALSTGAYAATAKKAPHGKSAKSALRASHHKANHGSLRVVAPRIIYLYWPGPTQPPASSSTDNNDDCANYQVNCTDQQNCELWGVNCNLNTNTTSGAQATAQDSSTSDGSTAGAQTDSAPADPATDAVAATDTSATESTTDTTANLADSQNDDQDC